MRLGYTDVFRCVSKSVIWKGKYLFKCMYWNDVFCPFLLCTNPSSPGISCHSIKSYHIFVLTYKNHCKDETKASTCGDYQLWCCLHFDLFVSYLPLFLYQTEKRWHGVNEGRHIQFSLYFYITRWDKIHHSFQYIHLNQALDSLRLQLMAPENVFHH